MDLSPTSNLISDVNNHKADTQKPTSRRRQIYRVTHESYTKVKKHIYTKRKLGQ